jgi:diaminopropionate ammonia-lyase
MSEITYSYLISEKFKKEFGQASFFTATDGNHGRGVAWAARMLGQKAIIRMPKGTVEVRKKKIEDENAEVTIEELNYDDCVRLAAEQASVVPRGVMIQDTAWEGYEEIPSYIMQGYGTMAKEADEQMQEQKKQKPTHIFVQAGVGSLAGAVVGYYANRYPEEPPKFIVIEAEAANCLYQSAKQGNGEICNVGGELETIMAGLACGEANTIAWDILKNHVDIFVSSPDWVTKKGMRMLGAPISGDERIISGESGAVAMGVISTIMKDSAYEELKEMLNMDDNSTILMFSTEGDTDEENYRKIVWGEE